MNQFEKISERQYLMDIPSDPDIKWANYSDIKLPKRATRYSAGYDFFLTRDISLKPGETVKVPTGIHVCLDEDKFLAVVPRSGLGFKYRLQLDNTIGIIDADYINSENEGHIFIKITNDSKEDKLLELEAGKAFAQGIIMSYFTTIDDEANGERNGGFGSTDKK